jgi:hypothetical protein
MGHFPAIDMDRVSNLLGTMLHEKKITMPELLYRLDVDELELPRVLLKGRRPLAPLAGKLRYIDVTGKLPDPGQEVPPFVMPANDDDDVADRHHDKGKLFFELYANVVPDIDRRALVAGLLDHNTMSVLYGASNTGKTFVAMGLGFSIATGRDWHGRKVEQGGVVYIAAEAGSNAKKRVAALRKHYGVEAAPFALVPCPVDLGGAGADVVALLALIAEAQKAMGCPVKLIVVDTLSRAMGGGEENSSKDMTAFVRNVDRLRVGTKAHLMVVHHAGKDEARGARGHSSLRAATDTELEVVKSATEQLGTISATKQRDMDAGPPIGFKLEPVVIGQNADGMPVTSCVAIPAAVQTKPVDLSPSATKALQVLQDACLGGGRVSLEKWEEAFIDEHYSKNPRSGETAFSRGYKRAVAEHLVHIVENMAWPAEKAPFATGCDSEKSL